MADDVDEGIIDSWEDADAEVTGHFIDSDSCLVPCLFIF